MHDPHCVHFLVLHSLSAAVHCRDPLNRTERVVCSDSELVKVDRQLSDLYEKALATSSAGARNQIEYEQAMWADSSGGCWNDVACIKKRYLERIAVLEGYVADFTKKPETNPASADREIPATSLEQRPIQLAEQQRGNDVASDDKALSEFERRKPDEGPLAQSDNSGASLPAPVSTGTPPAITPANGLRATTAIAARVQRSEAPGRATSRADNWNWLASFGLFVIVAVPLIYCLPAIVAFSRHHRNRWIILAINVAFGATVIGWIVALVWALNKVDAPIKGGIKYDLQPHDPIV